MIPSLVSGRPIFVTLCPITNHIYPLALSTYTFLGHESTQAHWTFGIEQYSPATLRSQANPNSNPPPSAGPSIAAIVGMGNASSFPKAARRSRRNLSTWTWVMVRRSARSAPAQKELGVEERMTRTRVLYQRESVDVNSLEVQGMARTRGRTICRIELCLDIL